MSRMEGSEFGVYGLGLRFQGLGSRGFQVSQPIEFSNPKLQTPIFKAPAGKPNPKPQLPLSLKLYILNPQPKGLDKPYVP